VSEILHRRYRPFSDACIVANEMNAAGDGATENAGPENARPKCGVENAGPTKYGKPGVTKHRTSRTGPRNWSIRYKKGSS